MKEITYEDWIKNPTPRVMWVWDNDEDAAMQLKVICLSKEDIAYPVVALTEDKVGIEQFRHCAEIEEPKTRRMTNKELSWWLKEKPTREFKYNVGRSVYSFHAYDEDCGDEEVRKDILIREDDSEWREPLVEDHYKD